MIIRQPPGIIPVPISHRKEERNSDPDLFFGHSLTASIWKMKFSLLKRRRSFLSSWIPEFVSTGFAISFFFFLKVKTRLRCFQVNVEIVLWNYHCMQDNGGIVFLFFQFLSCLRSFLFFFFSSLRIWNGKFVEKNILAMGISYTNLEL